jgi:hypothetical protein
MKFIHFGCWNNGICNIESGENGLSKTMRKIREKISLEHIDFITIAGDNYYPDKTKIGKEKIKNMITQNFLSGIRCLPDSIRKYIILGNHEYDNMRVDGEEKEECYLLKKQREMFTNPNTIFFDDVIHERYVTTLIIMIDTTIYEIYEENPETLIKDTCFREIFTQISPENKLTIKNLIDHQEREINKILSENIDAKNIIIIGHHPIISLKIKVKDGVSTDKENITKELVNLFINLGDKLTGKNLYYLCADTHNYQTGKVQLPNMPVINQYICGTGGAEQDECGIKKELSKENIRYYDIMCNKIFGFLVVSIDGDNISFEFVNATHEHNTHNGGFYTKYIKYKQKYILLKEKLNL